MDTFTQIDEIGAVAGHSYNQVTIVARIFLRVKQLLVPDDVELHPFAAHVSICLDKDTRFFQVVLCCYS